MNVRCSSLPRIMLCPASKAVPDVEIDEAADVQHTGSAVHAAMAELCTTEMDGIPDVKPYCDKWPLAVEKDVIRCVWKGGVTTKGRTALMSCPKCGKICSLSNHIIAEDGTVTPSVVCPREGCDFHEWIRLVAAHN